MPALKQIAVLNKLKVESISKLTDNQAWTLINIRYKTKIPNVIIRGIAKLMIKENEEKTKMFFNRKTNR